MAKWVDKDNGWEFETDRIYKRIEGNQILRYVDDLREFSKDKSYFYKVGTRNLANLPNTRLTGEVFQFPLAISEFSEFSEEYDKFTVTTDPDNPVFKESFPIKIITIFKLRPKNKNFRNYNYSFLTNYENETGPIEMSKIIPKLQDELISNRDRFIRDGVYFESGWGENATVDPKSFTIENIQESSFDLILPHINYTENGQNRVERFEDVGTEIDIIVSTTNDDRFKGVIFNTNWGDIFRTEFNATSDNSSSFTENKRGFLYFNSSPRETSETNNYISFDGTSKFDSTFGFEDIKMYELDWLINGLSWINDDTDLTTLNSRGVNNRLDYCNGWTYKEDTNSFIWYNLKSNDDRYYPVGDFPKKENKNYNTINYISKYVNLEKFNLSFQYTKAEGNISDTDSGIKIYLCNSEPPIKNNIDIFNRFLNSSILLEEIKDNGSFNFNFVGLKGNKYLIFVGDVPNDNDKDNLVVISNLKIQGEYLEDNNNLYNMDVSNSEISIDLENALYSSIVGAGKIKVTDDGLPVFNNIEPSEINSKIGNSYFKQGIWENGIWNSGYRDDITLREMYDVVFSIKVSSNKVWRVSISGPEESIRPISGSRDSGIDNLNIGDRISLSNIVGIDINNNRKPLRDFYNIVNVTPNTIEINIEASFPLRRIEKDSDKHRILLSKNVWLSGGFLNGYFKGIWNYGLFRGYPVNTKMEDSHWIEGIYDGGHFKGEEILFGSFQDTFYDDDKVGIIFNQPHNLAVGDIINIDKDDKTKNIDYDGEHRISKIVDSLSVVLNLDWGQNVESESGKYTTGFGSSLIQKMDFDSGNTSRITSNNTLESPVVFNYNSWIDVNYYNDSAVNIGKPQTVLNKNSRKYYSENNLYGYPTNDVLESKSKFRDSFSLETRIYSLGTKFKEFNDYIGESSRFSDFFGSEGEDLELFLEKGWSYSIADIPQQSTSADITFDRTESLGGFDAIEGEELDIKAIGNGAILDIDRPSVEVAGRTLGEIPKSRYIAIEFDLVEYSGDTDEYIPFFNTSIQGNSVSLVNSPEPVIHFDNINKVNRLELVQLETGAENEIVELRSATYLPIFENVNHIKTPKKRKIEYFFNKRHLSMNIRGNGNRGENESQIVIDNLRMFEINMIPFFKYFTEVNINKSVQTPLIGTSRYVDFNGDNSILIRSLDFDIREIELNKTDIDFGDSGIDIGVIPRNMEVQPTGTIDLDVNQNNFSITIIADSDVEWTVQSQVSWIDTIESNGTEVQNNQGGVGDATLDVTLDSNSSGSDRTGTITINGNGEVFTVSFIQPELEITLPLARFAVAGDLTIESDRTDFNVAIITENPSVGWSILVESDFLSLSQNSGTGNISIDVSTRVNNTSSDRTAELTLFFDNGSQTKAVTQEGSLEQDPEPEQPSILTQITLRYYFGLADPCQRTNPATGIFYIDSSIFSFASAIYLDEDGSFTAGSGWYKDASVQNEFYRFYNSSIGDSGQFTQNRGCSINRNGGGIEGGQNEDILLP